MDCTATLCYEVARPKKSPAKIDKGPIQDPAEGLKIQGGASNDLVHGLRTRVTKVVGHHNKLLTLRRYI